MEKSNTNESGNNGSSFHDDDDAMEIMERKSRCSFASICINLISCVLVALFVYSAIVQTNDNDGLQWIIFYALNAVLPAIFMCYYTPRISLSVIYIYLLSAVTSVWSIVLIVIASLNIRDTPPEGGTNERGGDNDKLTLREEYIFELAGALICLFSSLYHPMIARFCVKKTETRSYTVGEAV
mmetsp:Transcript_35248/g.38997  ORF Transcript_35248/g.38997 Transcript_35248/m.38997 type:complete len:182 (+) Transcript_35248:1-546(+)